MERKGETGTMEITAGIHAFVWNSSAANNCNTYLIDGPTRILVDPGHAAMFEHVRQALQKLGLGTEDVGLVLCTHAHPDHLEAVQMFKPDGALFAIHESDWRLVESMASQLSAMGIDIQGLAPDFFLQEGELDVDGTHLHVHHTPGHSPGSVCFYRPETKSLFTGDLVFKEGLGRTDLPGGSGADLKRSILRMAELDVNIVLPGHGEVIMGAEAVRRNFAALQQFYFAYI
jgi:glyoxylase-like metal-dependent hydrolase (beta-lactamase superfamily II)